MVEKANMLLHKRNAQLISGIEHRHIVLASRRRSDILCATPRRAEHIVDEGEESVRADGDALKLLEPFLALFGREWRGHFALVEVGFEICALVAGIGDQAAAEEIDGVGFAGALGAGFPLEGEGFGVEAHPPVVGFVAGEAGAVDAGCGRVC